jgi:hypothetical protein
MQLRWLLKTTASGVGPSFPHIRSAAGGVGGESADIAELVAANIVLQLLEKKKLFLNFKNN